MSQINIEELKKQMEELQFSQKWWIGVNDEEPYVLYLIHLLSECGHVSDMYRVMLAKETVFILRNQDGECIPCVWQYEFLI